MKNGVIERIKEIKKIEKLTNETFAEKTLLSVDTIKSMFSKKTNPNVETLLKIKSAFPLYSLDWIITGNERMDISNISVSEINIDYKEKYEELNKKYVGILEENRELSNENRNLHKQLEFIKRGEEKEREETKQLLPSM
jgi:transcriptional regulator with XRE-family HTH domain